MSPSTKPKFNNPRAKYNFQGRTCSIAGVGSYVPERVLTNADLERLVNTSDETRSYRLSVSFRDANGYETDAVSSYTGRVAPHATATWTAYGSSAAQLASCAFVGDPSSGAPSTPISNTTPATPGS